MKGRVWAVLVVILLCLAATDERAYLHSLLEQASAAEETASVPREGQRRTPRSKTRNVLVSRDFPVADLVDGEGNNGAAFGNPLALAEFLRQVTGKRNWRKEGEIEWLDRRRMLRVRQTPELQEQIEEQLQRMRGVGPGRIRLTLRLLVLPTDAEPDIVAGSASVISESERTRLENRWRGSTARDRDLVNKHSLPTGDILYGWTSTMLSDEASYRGLNLALQSSKDGRDVTLVPYLFTGDEDKVDWPELSVSVGQTAMYDLPTTGSDASTPDHTRVLAFITIDAITLTGSR